MLSDPNGGHEGEEGTTQEKHGKPKDKEEELVHSQHIEHASVSQSAGPASQDIIMAPEDIIMAPQEEQLFPLDLSVTSSQLSSEVWKLRSLPSEEEEQEQKNKNKAAETSQVKESEESVADSIESTKTFSVEGDDVVQDYASTRTSQSFEICSAQPCKYRTQVGSDTETFDMSREESQQSPVFRIHPQKKYVYQI